MFKLDLWPRKANNYRQFTKFLKDKRSKTVLPFLKGSDGGELDAAANLELEKQLREKALRSLQSKKTDSHWSNSCVLIKPNVSFAADQQVS